MSCLMGLTLTAEQRARSRQIDDKIKSDGAKDKAIQKLLLLGAGESGKSTVLKQMRALANDEYSEDELMHMTEMVYTNTVQAIQAIVAAMKQFGIEFENFDRQVDCQLVDDFIRVNGERTQFTSSITSALKRLWDDPGVKKCFQRANEFQVGDSAKYFLDDLDRIGSPKFKASPEDLLRIRVKTTGIIEMKFLLKNTMFRVFDVGGQRTERRKWIHCFEGVNGIIFIVALSEYNQVLLEDGRTNRMLESLHLFDTICNSPWFDKTAFILFLNKKDLFLEKIRNCNIDIAFPEYSGPQTYDDCVAFIEDKFRRVNKKHVGRQFYGHQTCATDTNQIQLVLDACIATLIEKNMDNAGFA